MHVPVAFDRHDSRLQKNPNWLAHKPDHLSLACSPRRVIQVLVARATKLPLSSVTSHSTRPMVRPCLTTRPTARRRAFQIGFRKLILSSSVLNDSPSPRFAA